MGITNKIKTGIITMALAGTGAYIGTNYGKEISDYIIPSKQIAPLAVPKPTNKEVEYRPVDMFMDEMKYQVDELEKRVQKRYDQRKQEHEEETR